MLYGKRCNPLKHIPPEIKILYDAVLIKKGVPRLTHFHYRKWLRYYLDFWLKYHHEPANQESFAPFVQKLKDKNQNEKKRKQAIDAVSIFYQIEKKKTDQDNAQVLKNKNENISTKNRIKINQRHLCCGGLYWIWWIFFEGFRDVMAYSTNSTTSR